MVIDKGKKRVSILGFSFKAGTDDLRESPVVDMIERLLGKGYDLRIYDRAVTLSRLVGANREFLMTHVPHISQLMVGSIEEALAHGETIVIANADPEFGKALGSLRENQVVVDLVRPAEAMEPPSGYDGICW
jgi:GDP-mannose 6-dehydrogenase